MWNQSMWEFEKNYFVLQQSAEATFKKEKNMLRDLLFEVEEDFIGKILDVCSLLSLTLFFKVPYLSEGTWLLWSSRALSIQSWRTNPYGNATLWFTTPTLPTRSTLRKAQRDWPTLALPQKDRWGQIHKKVRRLEPWCPESTSLRRCWLPRNIPPASSQGQVQGRSCQQQDATKICLAHASRSLSAPIPG